MQNSIALEYKGRTLRGMAHVPDGGDAPFPTVLIFHGFTGSKVDEHRLHVNFSRYLEGLGIASVRYDFLGSGESDGSFDEMTLSSEVDQAAAILESVRADGRFDSDRITAFGHSMGGIVAALLCGDAASAGIDPLPERLVLVAPAGNMADIVSHARELPPVAGKEGSVYDLGGLPLGEGFLGELPGLMEVAPARAGTYGGPVLVIQGAEDATVPPPVGREVAGWYRRPAGYAEIPGAGHCFSTVAHEAALFEAAGRFLKAAPRFRE